MHKLFGHFEKNFRVYYIISFLVLILICLPRFDQNNFWLVKKIVGNAGHLGEYNVDVRSYISMVKYFRGDAPIANLEIYQPFSYRILPIYLASLLPFKALTSINIINISCNIFSLLFLFKIFNKLKINKGAQIIPALLFVVSFPMFYFGTSGVIDPTLIFILILGSYYTISSNKIAYFILIFLAALVKETAVILIPIYYIFNYRSKNNTIETILAAGLFLISTFFIARGVIPIDPTHTFSPGWDFIKSNITRPRAYLSYVIGYAYFLPILYFINKLIPKSNLKNSLLAGIILGNGIFFYSFIAAYPDARLVWPAYPFTIIFLAVGFDKYYKNYSM